MELDERECDSGCIRSLFWQPSGAAGTDACAAGLFNDAAAAVFRSVVHVQVGVCVTQKTCSAE